jgi:hypothetical protein
MMIQLVIQVNISFGCGGKGGLEEEALVMVMVNQDINLRIYIPFPLTLKRFESRNCSLFVWAAILVSDET